MRLLSPGRLCPHDSAPRSQWQTLRSGEAQMSEPTAEDPRGGPAATVDDLLRRMADGDDGARAELFTRVYDQLKAMARRRTAQQPVGHTLQATALVHEAFLRMCGNQPAAWTSRAHFFAVAAHAMRSVLVDHAKKKNRGKRRPPGPRVALDELDDLLGGFQQRDDILDIDAALCRLAQMDPELVRLVELRYFTGLPMPECAHALGVSESTAHRAWNTAKAFLHRELHRD